MQESLCFAVLIQQAYGYRSGSNDDGAGHFIARVDSKMMRETKSEQRTKIKLPGLALGGLVVVSLMFGAMNARAAEIGDSAADFSLPLLSYDAQTQSHTLYDYAGKIVYLDFWASWCPPCLVSMPIMNELRNRLQSQGIAFEVLAVNVDSDPEDGLDFLEDKPVDFVVLSDPQGTSPALYGIKGMPTSYLINASGIVEFKHEGFRPSDGEKIENEILKLLETSQ